MKKIGLVILLLLSGCTVSPQYYLYVYYAQTCPHCQSFIKVVIPQLEDIYQDQMEIITMDIDQEESLDAYAKTCSLLEDYHVNDDSGSVPFIVLDGYFALVGYQMGQDEDMIALIDDAVHRRQLSIDDKEIYFFKEGQTFHEGGN